jgi:hypothetical protein
VSLIFLLSTTLSAQSLPRVLILDFKNKSGNSSLGYLEASITDAVNAEMKKRFTFAETTPEQWKSVAEKNYFFENDYATDSAAVNIGLLTHQDVVVAGNINAGRSNAQVIVSIGIFDIGQKKKIEELNLPLLLSANMFGDIEKIAVKVSDTAAHVLPNKEDWHRSGLAGFTGKRRQHVYLLGAAGLIPWASNKVDTLNDKSVVSADNFSLKGLIQLQYELDQIWKPYLFAWGGPSIEFGSQNFDTGAGGMIKGTLFSWEVAGGIGMHVIERVRWRVSVLAGTGVYFQSLKYDYTSDSVFALHSSSQTLETGKSNQALGLTASLAGRFAFRFTPDVSAFAGITARNRFFQNSVGLTGYLYGGAGYDF